MKAGFSEFQFAYGCTRELEDRTFWFGRLGAPLIPSLVQEELFASDVIFWRGPLKPIFIQYKLSEKLAHRTAKERHLFGGSAYFRFKPYPQSISNQHNKLVDLGRKTPNVFYCAPAFITETEYFSFHNTKAVITNSVFVPCGQLPHNSGRNQHSVVFNISPRFSGYWCSDPIQIEIRRGDKGFLDQLLERGESFSTSTALLDFLESILEIREFSIQTDQKTSRLQKIIDFAVSNYGLSIQLVSAKGTGE